MIIIEFYRYYPTLNIKQSNGIIKNIFRITLDHTECKKQEQLTLEHAREIVHA